jgi:hypothetical protein
LNNYDHTTAASVQYAPKREPPKDPENIVSHQMMKRLNVQLLYNWRYQMGNAHHTSSTAPYFLLPKGKRGCAKIFVLTHPHCFFRSQAINLLRDEVSEHKQHVP